MNMQTRITEFRSRPELQPFAGDLDVYRTLLESTNAIPWKIDWATLRFEYIGPQIETLLGWSQDSWQSVEDWSSRMHPDDRDQAVNFCVAQSQAGVDHEMDYRALTSDNRYIWIRDVVHVVRRPDGEVDCLIGFMFDIDERKRVEEELACFQRKLEVLSFEDGLTRIANRRMFDDQLERNLRQMAASDQPLSLIMLDIDQFKQFNDHYGHIEGDECLKKVAQALKSVRVQGDDVVARYGGEEFAILLPGTDADAALAKAEQCRDAIAALAIAHGYSGCGDMVTASIGVGTLGAGVESTPSEFVAVVDRLLYAAKEKGRDRIEAKAW